MVRARDGNSVDVTARKLFDEAFAEQMGSFLETMKVADLFATVGSMA